MNLGKGLGHLTYSTLVHPTDDWDQLWKSVTTYLPAVKARVAPHEKFGVCLRTSAPSAAALSADPRKRATLKQFFADQDLYLYTANAFVYGVFKKQVIKEDVYEPDWQPPERRDYTKQVASLLAEHRTRVRYANNCCIRPGKEASAGASRGRTPARFVRRCRRRTR
jgi:hypothetical protein